MHIVNLETFKALPAGTVYMDFSPMILGELQIKGHTWEHAFIRCDLTTIDCSDSSDFVDKLDLASQDPEYFISMDFDCYSTDIFEGGALFAVLDYIDVCGLVDKLRECQKTYERHNL